MIETEDTPVNEYTHARAVHFTAPEQWIDYTFNKPDGSITVPGKKWVKDLLGLTGTEVSLSSMPPGGEVPFHHVHDQNEELYIFLSGEGQMLIDGEVIDVRPGSLVRVDPPAVRCWRNTGDTHLVHLVVQAKAGSLEQWTGTDGTFVDAAGWPE